MLRSGNLAARLFERQILTPRPGTSVNCARQFYENLVPNCTVYDVDCPENSFRKFTDDGLYLISFSRNLQELIVYRPTWFSFSFKGEASEFHYLPPKSQRFDSYFTQLYSTPLASCTEFICKDFFLYVENHQFGLFATSTVHNHNAPASDGALPGVPSIEKITFHLVRLEDGSILDEKVFHNDFIHLSHNMGVFLYDELLCITSLRYQAIHIIQIRDSGSLVSVRTIGRFCREDDELFLSSHSKCAAMLDDSREGSPSNNPSVDVNGQEQHLASEESPFLSGIKQRLLSFIFRGLWGEETDIAQRVQLLKKKFYFHFQDYVDLVMSKVQFLDRHHLLIKFGSVDGVVPRSAEQYPAFFAVYNMETADVISFHQNSSEELYILFEQFCDHFLVASRFSSHINFISSHSNCIHALEQLKNTKGKASSFSQFVRKMLVSLNFGCQSQSPSPYLDQSLFRYDEKLISAAERPRQIIEHPVKFISRRQPNTLKFKIKSGFEGGVADNRAKRLSSFLFHPILPFVLSIQQTAMQPTIVNIHFRR
ncbi:light-mediated development protein 1 / deetiolated1 (DET1) isoform X2 [Wolffia australiana]